MKNKFPNPECEYSLMVVCSTYNHAKYIKEALEGILLQRVDFSIIVCVVDDHSTDGTTDIIKKYETDNPDLIKLFYFEENQYSKGDEPLFVLAPWIYKVKYIALCEGDDYWTDPLKLQKQVDFMESHQDCKMSFHSVTEHWQDNRVPNKIFFPVEDRVYTGTEIFKQWVVATCSVMIRSEVFKEKQVLDIFNNKKLMYYDQALFMYCAIEGKLMGMSDVMAVYRRVRTGYTLLLESDLKHSAEVAQRYCQHCRTMDELFSRTLGWKFKRIIANRYIGTALYSFVRCAKGLDFRYSFEFLIKAFSYYPLLLGSFIRKKL